MFGSKAVGSPTMLMKFWRLMCWPHTYRKIVSQLKAINGMSTTLGSKLLEDIVVLQWSVLTEESFFFVHELLETKYLSLETCENNKDLLVQVKIFFVYFKKVWVNSKEYRWFEFANPWHVSHNQGLEGKNRDIKATHTIRNRMPLGRLIQVFKRMLHEWSLEDDGNLRLPRTAILHQAPDGLKLRTEGYECFKENSKPGDIIKIKVKDKFTVSELHQLGQVTNMWAVKSSSNKSNEPLVSLAKVRVAERKLPSSASFDD